MNITFEQIKETIEHMYFLDETTKDREIRIFYWKYFQHEEK